MAIVQLDPKLRVWEGFLNLPLHLNGIALGHLADSLRMAYGHLVKTSGSPCVTTTVCSKWAESAPSTVTAVH